MSRQTHNTVGQGLAGVNIQPGTNINFSYQGITSHTGGSGRVIHVNVPPTGLNSPSTTTITKIQMDPVNVVVNDREPAYQSYQTTTTTVTTNPPEEPDGYFREYLLVIKDFILPEVYQPEPNRPRLANKACTNCQKATINTTFRKCGHSELCDSCATSMVVLKKYYKPHSPANASKLEDPKSEYHIRCPICSSQIRKIVLIK